MGIDGQPMVYLDVSHLPPERQHKLEGILEIYEKFVGDDPRKVPMKIFPGMHYTMRRPLGRLQPADEHSRRICCRRSRLLHPRSQSLGS